MKKLLIIIAILISKTTFCQTSAGLDNPKASFISIIVANIDSSIKWYQGTFGMTLKARTENAQRGSKYASLERSRLQIELLEVAGSASHDQVQKKLEGASVQGFARFGIRVRDFDAWSAFLATKKIEFAGVVDKDANGKRMISVKDPDGNIIQVAEE